MVSNGKYSDDIIWRVRLHDIVGGHGYWVTFCKGNRVHYLTALQVAFLTKCISL